MTLKISNRAKNAPSSPIRKLVVYADGAKERGTKVYHLNIGQPDLKIPVEIEVALKSCSNTDYLPYEQSQGTKELQIAWKKYLEVENIFVEPENIFVTTGGSEALVMASAIVCNPGEEIIAFEPFYANYLGFANMVSAKIVPVNLDANNNFHLPDLKAITSKITSKTRAILINNPNNPTGTVFTKKELLQILEIAKKYNLFIISDEAYGGICFDDKKFYSIFSLASKSEQKRIIIVDSLSKKFNVCGARIGAIISTEKSVLSAINCFAQQRLSVSTLDQRIVLPALKTSQEYIAKITKQYQERRDTFIHELEMGLNAKIHLPEGAFYTMVKLPITDSDHFAKWLLTEFSLNGETVMVAPGSGFYATKNFGKDEIRVAFVLNKTDLKRSAQILSIGLKKYCSIFTPIKSHSSLSS